MASRNLPMLWVLLPLVVGIVCAKWLCVSLLAAWIAFALFVALFLYFRYTQFIYGVIFTFAMVVVSFEGDSSVEPSFALRLQHWSACRVERLGLSEEAQASTMAIALGQRQQLSDEVVASYRRSGTSHLLALSGLHITIVFIFISLLLYYLPLLGRGHIVADILAIVLVWLFASMAGLGISVVRAAAMFTLLRLSWLFSMRYDSLNSLFSAAAIILIFDCGALYDVGFQLSVISVLGIMLWVQPLSRALRGSWFVVNWVLSAIVVGVVATVASAPLVSHYFGAFSWLSPLTTLPLLFTLSVIILSTLVWILLPLPFLAPLVREVITECVAVQNYIVERVALFDAQLIEYRATGFEVVVLYSIYLIITIFYYRSVSQREADRSSAFDAYKS